MSDDMRSQIFDYMNVQSIHNETFAKNLPDGYLERVRALANFHEYGVFTSPQVDGVGNSMSPTHSVVLHKLILSSRRADNATCHH